MNFDTKTCIPMVSLDNGYMLEYIYFDGSAQEFLDAMKTKESVELLCPSDPGTIEKIIVNPSKVSTYSIQLEDPEGVKAKPVQKGEAVKVVDIKDYIGKNFEKLKKNGRVVYPEQNEKFFPGCAPVQPVKEFPRKQIKLYNVPDSEMPSIQSIDEKDAIEYALCTALFYFPLGGKTALEVCKEWKQAVQGTIEVLDEVLYQRDGKRTHPAVVVAMAIDATTYIITQAAMAGIPLEKLGTPDKPLSDMILKRAIESIQ
jgi:hypothetical protein